MKRNICIILTIMVLSAGSLAAAGDTRSYVGLNITGQESTSLGVSFDGGLQLSIAGDFGMNFKSGWGFEATAGYTYQTKSFLLRPSATFLVPLNQAKSISLLLLAGPKIYIKDGAVTWGLDVMCHFDFLLGKSMYIRLGTGVQMLFGKDKVQGYIPIPDFAIGWQF